MAIFVSGSLSRHHFLGVAMQSLMTLASRGSLLPSSAGQQFYIQHVGEAYKLRPTKRLALTLHIQLDPLKTQITISTVHLQSHDTSACRFSISPESEVGAIGR